MNEENDFTTEEAFKCANDILNLLDKNKVPPRLGYTALSITHMRIHHALGLTKEQFMELAEHLCNGVYGKEEKE